MKTIPLLVAPNEKELVKKLGAKWNKEQQVWTWPTDKDRKPVKKWLPRIYRNDLKPPHIMPALVPESMWGVNLRSLLTKEQWDFLRKECYRNAAYHCQVCGTKGNPPHCNEQWTFKFHRPPHPEANKGIQQLQRLACLCEDCHRIKHLGFARVTGKLSQAINHIAKINGWPKSMASDVAEIAFREWEKRNQYDWKLDLNYLAKQYNIIVVDISGSILKKKNEEYMRKIERERNKND